MGNVGGMLPAGALFCGRVLHHVPQSPSSTQQTHGGVFWRYVGAHGLHWARLLSHFAADAATRGESVNLVIRILYVLPGP